MKKIKVGDTDRSRRPEIGGRSTDVTVFPHWVRALEDPEVKTDVTEKKCEKFWRRR